MTHDKLPTTSNKKMPRWAILAAAGPIGIAALAGCSGNAEAGSSSESATDSRPQHISSLTESLNVYKDGTKVSTAALIATQNTETLCEMGINNNNATAQSYLETETKELLQNFKNTDAYNTAVNNPNSTTLVDGTYVNNAKLTQEVDSEINEADSLDPYLVQAYSNTAIGFEKCDAKVNTSGTTYVTDDNGNKAPVKDTDLIDYALTNEGINNGTCAADLRKELDNTPENTNPQNFSELKKSLERIKLENQEYVASMYRDIPC